MKRRASPEAKDHLIDEWGEIVSPMTLAEKLDRFEIVRQPSKRPIGNQNKGNFQVVRSDEPRRKMENKEKHMSSPKRSDQEKSREYEKRKPIRCFECNGLDHIRPSCPYRKRKDDERVNQLQFDRSAEETFEPYTSTATVNGKQTLLLRDTGASIDLTSSIYAPKHTFTGEVVWIRSPLESYARCLPLARVVLEGDFGKVVTKAAVVEKQLDQNRYLLGNRTAELIRNIEKGTSKHHEQINMLTRAQARIREKQAEQLEAKRVEINPLPDSEKTDQGNELRSE